LFSGGPAIAEIERAKQFERKEMKQALNEDKVGSTYFLFKFLAIYAPRTFLFATSAIKVVFNSLESF